VLVWPHLVVIEGEKIGTLITVISADSAAKSASSVASADSATSPDHATAIRA
jgi:hypothetical protein